MDAASWSAVAAWITLGVAAAAALIALGQVREAQRLRREQAQPYVVAYLEESAANPHLIDFKICNLGATAARDVRVRADPELERIGEGDYQKIISFESLPVLVPKQEWRTFWDSGLERKGSSLPDRYDVTVSYRDSTGRHDYEEHFVLDWSTLKGRLWVQEYGVHDLAKAVRELQRDIHRWREGNSGIRVFVRDGDAKDESQRRFFEERRRSADQQSDEDI